LNDTSATFTEFLNFLKFRGGLVDGYRHLDREMHEQYLNLNDIFVLFKFILRLYSDVIFIRFFTKYPHPQGEEIPPDYYGEVSSNNGILSVPLFPVRALPSYFRTKIFPLCASVFAFATFACPFSPPLPFCM
jgi:hypothetical protein